MAFSASAIQFGARPAAARAPVKNQSRFYLAACAGTLAVLGAWCVVGAARYTARLYEVDTLRRHVRTLQERQQELTVKLSELTSVNVGREQLAAAGFVPVTDARFIGSTDVSLR